jgi:drug/metabolite transporter (DMT)-like permease
MPPTTANNSMAWLYFALLTVASWGVYGIFLHKGQVGIAPGDPNARYKAFLFVGIAYFLVAIVAPIAVLVINGANWKFEANGMWLSLVAGIVGAIGAFGALLAFGAGGLPAVVMAIIFAGAPVVNALVAIWMADLWGETPVQFWLGLVLAASGGCLVTYYKPNPHPPAKPSAPAAPHAAAIQK